MIFSISKVWNGRLKIPDIIKYRLFFQNPNREWKLTDGWDEKVRDASPGPVPSRDRNSKERKRNRDKNSKGQKGTGTGTTGHKIKGTIRNGDRNMTQGCVHVNLWLQWQIVQRLNIILKNKKFKSKLINNNNLFLSFELCFYLTICSLNCLPLRAINF